MVLVCVISNIAPCEVKVMLECVKRQTCGLAMRTTCRALNWIYLMLTSSGLSISFEVASSFWKVDVSLLSERRRREPPRGVWGHAPPENFEI